MKFLTHITCLRVFSLVAILCGLSSCGESGDLVRDVAAFERAVAEAVPGDRIVLADGVWKDTELVFTGQGTSDAPITLTVETKGGVTLEGQSNLQLSGEHLVVEGLVFKNGYSLTSDVISFRTTEAELCNNCRVTECVIDNYNNPERRETDIWVQVFGKNNRFDHNYLTGKRNNGVTMAVRLNTEASRENHHRIDHNYFGPRPVFGSNGGETLRIGTSHYSLSNSNTVVEYNYFDRCNGEHEIISNKAGQNTYRNNTFFECQGTLTMRHGNETLVENNFFFGNGKPNTGGIRIINERQRVINNYGEGLTGYRFRGALVIMNGVPDSPLNRYFQVKDSEASNNTFINCDYIQLCAGSDEERSATPENTVLADNIFYSPAKDDLFTVYDDISGIRFEGNLISPNVAPPVPEGFTPRDMEFTRKNGLLVPSGSGLEGIGFAGTPERATPENTGVSWYPRQEEGLPVTGGRVISVPAGTNTLFDALATAGAGDILELTESGDYLQTKSLSLNIPITVRAAASLADKPVLLFERPTLFQIDNGGSLSLEGVIVDGREAPDRAGNSVIRTSPYSMIQNYHLSIIDCEVRDLDINHSFQVLRAAASTFADSIVLRNSSFQTVSGHVLSLAEERDDIGVYNVENVIVENCSFTDIGGAAIQLYRGGGDESTFGPMLRIRHCVFDSVGWDQRNRTEASIDLHGVQYVDIAYSQFLSSRPIDLFLTVGEPITRIRHCNFYQTAGITANDDAYQTEGLRYLEPDSPQLQEDEPGRVIGLQKHASQ